MGFTSQYLYVTSSLCYIKVDAHNVVPCWEASGKLEYGARTIRGKITKLLPEFLTEIPPVDTHPHPASHTAKVGSPFGVYFLDHISKCIMKLIICMRNSNFTKHVFVFAVILLNIVVSH